jgi:mono/diheme cytochrome c family protein
MLPGMAFLDDEIYGPSHQNRVITMSWNGKATAACYGFFLLIFVAAFGTVANAADEFTMPAKVQTVLADYCVTCHGDQGKGNVNLTGIEKLPLNQRLELLNSVQDQLFYGMMPPPKSDRLPAPEQSALSNWVRSELRRHKASKLDERLPTPSAGNNVDHARLFSGEIQDPPYSPARRWLIHPAIFQERVRDSLGLEGRERSNKLPGVLNPFTLPERSGVRDYDLTRLDGSHFVVMQSNAAWMAARIVGSLRVKAGEPIETVLENPKSDRWLPVHTTPDKAKTPTMPAFERIVMSKSPPTDDEMLGAIRFQFQRVLRRLPTDSEAARYLKLFRAAIEVGGNATGLQKMLEATWLESEFLYRVEFGDGAADQHGRRMLTPREASYAIAFALGDRGPDAALVKAATEGRLNTKADYEREVKRLLADTAASRGQIDSIMHEIYPSYSKNNLSDRPKLVRFFREFFGYAQATRVFKDLERSNGYYQNPDRGTYGTPGILIREADLFVNAIVQADTAVFETLLTSDRFFVSPFDDAAKKVQALNEVYDHFKDRNWKVDINNKKPTPWLSPEELAFVRKRLNHNSSERDLSLAMTHVEHYRKNGLAVNPQWSYPFGIHKLTPHVNSYNFAPPTWAYECQQPFSVPQRKGILTHPAWLIAHSQNSATDPVVRGRFLREKLLAGIVPDVPITVDAVIPEHADKTLRERLDLVTNKQACWKCHQHMNPLGLAFEMYDDFGRFRTKENLEHPDNIIAKAKTKYGADTYKTASIISSGRLDGTGDPKLDGDVTDALDLIDRLAKSERVRQSIIRHAFRFYFGRNEMLSDSRTLIDADRAYVQSGGSFQAVVVSLLTSDSFMYRKTDPSSQLLTQAPVR